MDENNENVKAEETTQSSEATKTTTIDFKEEAGKAKNLFLDLIKKPLETIKTVATDKTMNYFKVAIGILIIWVLLAGLLSYFTGIDIYKTFSKFKRYYLESTIKSALAPIVGIAVYSAIVFFMNKKDSAKPFTTVVSTFVVAKIPVVLATLISFIRFFGDEASKITSPVNSIARVLFIVLSYFGMKSLFNEESDSKFFNKFVLITALYYVAYIVCSFFEIYI